MIPIKSVSSLEVLTLTSQEKNGLEFFNKKISNTLNIFSPKNRRFLGVKPGPLESPIIQLMVYKNIWGVLLEKIEYLSNMSKKSIFLYYEIEQNYNFIVKTKSFITQRFLNQSG